MSPGGLNFPATSPMTVEIPDIPKSAIELEDVASALFQAAGYFVERNVIERDTDEVLELDACASLYDGGPPQRILVEAKSGVWGYADVFKLLGWMTYLGVEQGALVVTQDPGRRDFTRVRERAQQFGIRIVRLGADADHGSSFHEQGFPRIEDPQAIAGWQFAFATERALHGVLRRKCKSEPLRVGLATALRYHQLLNNELFFERDVRQRLRHLYEAFAKHPKLTLGVAREEDGQAFSCDGGDSISASLRAALYDGGHWAIQASMHLEHRARLALLKAAVDYTLARDPAKPLLRSGNEVLMDEDALLPSSFREAVAKLKNRPGFDRYPAIWQVLIWGFGGFYLVDREDEELGWIAAQTGVEVETVREALDAFDVLFPSTGGWWWKASNSHCRLLKMVPMVIQGLGAYQRGSRYGTKYAELGYTDLTLRDLEKWHKDGYKLLYDHLGPAPSSSGEPT